MITSTDPETLQVLEGLLADYCHCLDNQDFKHWPEFFTDDCSYEIRQIEDQERGFLVGLIVDSNRQCLFDRVKFITEVWEGSIEPYRTRHFFQITNIQKPLADATILVESNLQVIYTSAESTSAVLASGHYIDKVQLDSDKGAKFVNRTVVLDGIPARALNYPL